MRPSSKIALGTVQFGMNYGVNNKRGQIPAIEVSQILCEASQHGITCLDTAQGYGNSEEVIGRAAREFSLDFDVVTKLPTHMVTPVEACVAESQKRLGLHKLYGCLVHRFDLITQGRDVWDGLRRVRREGLVAKIGCSLYYLHELDYLFSHVTDCDLIQVPYNVFDQRFEPYFAEAKKRGMEIHVRSVFLQGMVFKKPEELAPQFAPMKKHLLALQHIASDSGLSLTALCLNFVCLNPDVDRVIVGVDGLDHLRANMAALLCSSAVNGFSAQLGELAISDENMVVPSLWNKGTSNNHVRYEKLQSESKQGR
ncbi:MAG TPA: aldo/keto reductase [bacterium]|nr:aldo/keto reductase [bacterium]